MGKLRHIAIAVSNTDESAKFYEQAFGLKRVRESVSAILLSDGVISLAILDNKTSHEAVGQNGLHHFGFIADNVDESAARAEANGAVYADKAENVAKRFANRGDTEEGEVKATARLQDQRKYVDPNGI
jgi:catechol 2,3-dioxygenase-like lactoylglutathione lyase family enzyme